MERYIPVEAPAKAPAEGPAKTPAEAPAKASAEVPAEAKPPPAALPSAKPLQPERSPAKTPPPDLLPAEPSPAALSSAERSPAKLPPAESARETAPAGPPGRIVPETTGPKAAGSAAAVPAAAVPTEADRARAAEYVRRDYTYIQRRIRDRVVYPDQAKRMGLQGVTEVAFTIRQDGTVSNLSVRLSSGEEVLDKAALEAVRAASPFRPPPAQARIVIPVVFKLR